MITSLRVLVPGGVGALFFVDLLYRGQTGRKTLLQGVAGGCERTVFCGCAGMPVLQ